MPLLPKACLISMAVLACATPLVGAAASAPETGQVAVFFDPRVSSQQLMQSVAQSDGQLVRLGGVPGAAIINLTTAEDRAALRRAGALIFADPIILGGCSPSQSQKGLS